MIRVLLLGLGNVGSHIYYTFEKHPQIDVIQVYSRSSKSLEVVSENTATTTSLENLKDADVTIIALPDSVIEQVSKKLPFEEKLVVHTSGSVGITQLHSKNRRGVWYPLQTFSKNKDVDFGGIPLCVEAENASDLDTLTQLAKMVSENVNHITSEQRASLHLAAVFANNFSNHMYHIAQQIVDEKGVDFKLLQPLIAESAEKLKKLSPKEAQTGPAIRNDKETIARHLEALSKKDHKKLYTFITQSIQDYNSK